MAARRALKGLDAVALQVHCTRGPGIGRLHLGGDATRCAGPDWGARVSWSRPSKLRMGIDSYSERWPRAPLSALRGGRAGARAGGTGFEMLRRRVRLGPVLGPLTCLNPTRRVERPTSNSGETGFRCHVGVEFPQIFSCASTIKMSQSRLEYLRTGRQFWGLGHGAFRAGNLYRKKMLL